MLPVPKSRGVQFLSESSVARLIYAVFIVIETRSSVAVPPTIQGSCSESLGLLLGRFFPFFVFFFILVLPTTPFFNVLVGY